MILLDWFVLVSREVARGRSHQVMTSFDRIIFQMYSVMHIMDPSSQGDNKIFRAKALASASGGNRLNTLSPVISPHAWVVTLAMVLLLGIIVYWGFNGRIPISVVGSGVFLHGERIDTVHTTVDGLVIEIRKRPGDQIAAGECLAVLKTTDSMAEIVALEAGELISIDVEVGDSVASGRTIGVVVVGPSALKCIAFLPITEGKLIESGQSAIMHYNTAAAGGNGQARGKVIFVEKFMTSAERIFSRVPNQQFVAMIQERFGSVAEVGILVEADAQRRDLITNAMPCEVEVRIGSMRPINLILPEIRFGDDLQP